MPSGAVQLDIKVLGDKRVRAKLNRLDLKVRNKIIKNAMKNSLRRIKPKIIDAFRGGIVDDIDRRGTGGLAEQLEGKRLRTETIRSDGIVRIFLPMPTRAELGIPAHQGDEKGFYPFSLEYGRKNRPPAPAYAPVRRIVNENMDREIMRIKRKTVQGVLKAWRSR